MLKRVHCQTESVLVNSKKKTHSLLLQAPRDQQILPKLYSAGQNPQLPFQEKVLNSAVANSVTSGPWGNELKTFQLYFHRAVKALEMGCCQQEVTR